MRGQWRAVLAAVVAAGGVMALPQAGSAAGDSPVFSVMTYNTWGLPTPVGYDVQRRYSQLPAQLHGFDWVTLQETFSRAAGELSSLPEYPHRAWQSDGGFLKISSGLMTLSRYPIVAREYREFQASTDADRFSRKGVLFTRLQVRPDLIVDLYNTHYQAQDYPEAEGVRTNEDNRVFAEMVKAHDKGYPTFIQGDFNSHDYEPAYLDLRRRLPLHDLWAENRAGDAGLTCDNARNPFSGDCQERIDYLFFLDSPTWQARVERIALGMTAPVSGTFLSDHFAVQARVRLERKTAAKP